MKKCLICGMLIVVFLFSIQAQTPEKKLYTATRISAPPAINGVLDDAAWQSGTWIDDFTQYEPFNGRAASLRTEFNILFDDNCLYVAIKAFDTSPDSIVNRLTRRDE
ncbi:MAG: sugar-binding protein, partial [Bacteroidota bacterium]|nr:sugar-binding protein [Bacteroidota bacterium]